MTLEVSEIFFSLQGEGPYSGRPAVFLRLSGCLAPLCPWCDTRYACGRGRKMDLDSVMDRIRSFGSDFIVITGGEPFLQWDNGLDQLERMLLKGGHEIQYETGGKLPIPDACKGLKVCSPKYIDGRWRYVESNTSRADIFKFTASGRQPEILSFVRERGIPKEKVWIMPLGATREEQLKRLPGVWAFCVENRFNLSSRLHILAFDNKRGV